MLPPRSAARIISFRSMLPGTALLNMVGLLQDERPHITERRKPGAILEHSRAGEVRRPSPGRVHPGVGSNRRCVSHDVVPSDHC